MNIQRKKLLPISLDSFMEKNIDGSSISAKLFSNKLKNSIFQKLKNMQKKLFLHNLTVYAIVIRSYTQ